MNSAERSAGNKGLSKRPDNRALACATAKGPFNMTNIDLSQVPANPEDAKGYDQIYRVWKRLADAFSAGRELPSADFRSEMSNLRTVLRPREVSLMDEPHEASIAHIPEAVQAKTQARLQKVLMDRQGFHVKRENGGLR